MIPANHESDHRSEDHGKMEGDNEIPSIEAIHKQVEQQGLEAPREESVHSREVVAGFRGFIVYLVLVVTLIVGSCQGWF